jgi:hypothetical protein
MKAHENPCGVSVHMDARACVCVCVCARVRCTEALSLAGGVAAQTRTRVRQRALSASSCADKCCPQGTCMGTTTRGRGNGGCEERSAGSAEAPHVENEQGGHTKREASILQAQNRSCRCCTIRLTGRRSAFARVSVLLTVQKAMPRA